MHFPREPSQLKQLSSHLMNKRQIFLISSNSTQDMKGDEQRYLTTSFPWFYWTPWLEPLGKNLNCFSLVRPLQINLSLKTDFGSSASFKTVIKKLNFWWWPVKLGQGQRVTSDDLKDFQEHLPLYSIIKKTAWLFLPLLLPSLLHKKHVLSLNMAWWNPDAFWCLWEF